MRRLLDIVASSLLLLLSSPVLVLAALAICFRDRGPIFLRQTRSGLGGSEFQVLKLRSMRVNDLPVPETEVGEEDPMVTSVGRWMRRLKIDELPQLLNVLCGEMSLIGP